ncbi:MAG: peptide ABC transporter substrate-binding protein [Bdellovibrionota bacterium]
MSLMMGASFEVQSVEKNIFRVGAVGQIHSLDPALISNHAEREILRQAHESLLRRNPETGEIEAFAAQSYRMSEDGMTYTFVMRNDLFWSDGRPIAAQDYAYALKRLLQPTTKSSFAAHFSSIKGAEKLLEGAFVSSDDLGIQSAAGTLVLTLTYPDPFFLHWLTYPETAAVDEKSLTIDKKWIFSGAYTIETKSPDMYVLHKNPHHRNARSIDVDEIDYHLYPTIGDGVSAFHARKIDVIGSQAHPVPYDHLSMYGGTDNVRFAPDLKTYFLRMNEKHLVMSQSEFRKAIAMSIDRDNLYEKVSFAGERQAYSLMPDQLGPYKAPHGYYYSLFGAKESLSNLGYCVPHKSSKSDESATQDPCLELPKLTMLYPEGYEYRKIALALTVLLKQNLGLEIFPRATSEKQFLKLINKGSYMMALDEVAASPEFPYGILESFRSQKGSAGSFESKEYDDLLNQAQAAISMEKANVIYHQAESFLLTEIIAIPLLFDSTSLLISPMVKNYALSPWDLQFFQSISISRPKKNHVVSGS